MVDSTTDAKAPPTPINEPDEEQPTLTFHGTNGVECEDFINNVRCRALEQGKIRDNDWLVTFAKSCCRDGALEFVDSLDDSVKGDWKQLRKALLKNYPAPLWREHSSVLPSPPPSSITKSFLEPIPAAASPVPPGPPPPPPKPLGPLPKPDPSAAEASFRGQTQKFLIKGHIKVTIPPEKPDSPSFQAYIAKPPSSNCPGDIKLTLDKSKALLLGYSSPQTPYVVMSVMKCKCGRDCLAKVGQPFKCGSAYGVWDFLAARWTPSLGPEPSSSASLVAVDTYTTASINELAMWRVAPGCDLAPVRISSDGAHHVEVVVKPNDLSIRLEAKSADSKAPDLGGWKPAVSSRFLCLHPTTSLMSGDFFARRPKELRFEPL
ncbi:hypothetical protein FRC01_003823 [Tulasnella sp. 417]|nr:hypothetical protein FRC01_003823 [Tulasnella sp. 417]